jgi:hypothetical protein
MPWYAEKGNYSNLSWDTARNGFRASGWREYSDLYSYHGAGLLPVDIYEVIVNLTGGSSLPAIPVAVKSNRVMPVVDTLTHYTDLVAVDDKKKSKKHDKKKGKKHDKKKAKKSGKKNSARETTVTVENLRVRELDGQLIVQWAEPDGAFQPPIYLGYEIGISYHNRGYFEGVEYSF